MTDAEKAAAAVKARRTPYRTGLNSIQRIYHVQRPLSSGKSYKFFNSIRRTVVYGGITSSTGSLNVPETYQPFEIPGTSLMDPQYNCSINPTTFPGASLLQLLFENEPSTYADAKIQNAKCPDMFKYISAVPVYYGIKVTIQRAYIELFTDTSGSGGTAVAGPSDIQFAQNLAEGQAIDFYWYWDSQNYNKALNFAATPSALSQMLDIRKFKFGKHRPGDGMKCSFAGDTQLPKVLATGSVFKPYPMSANSTETMGVTLQNYLGSVTATDVGILQPPGNLYFCPVMPLCNSQFRTLFNKPLNTTDIAARLYVDFNVTTKLIVNCSNNLGVISQWRNLSGDLIPVIA